MVESSATHKKVWRLKSYKTSDIEKQSSLVQSNHSAQDGKCVKSLPRKAQVDENGETQFIFVDGSPKKLEEGKMHNRVSRLFKKKSSVSGAPNEATTGFKSSLPNFLKRSYTTVENSRKPPNLSRSNSSICMTINEEGKAVLTSSDDLTNKRTKSTSSPRRPFMTHHRSTSSVTTAALNSNRRAHARSISVDPQPFPPLFNPLSQNSLYFDDQQRRKDDECSISSVQDSWALGPPLDLELSTNASPSMSLQDLAETSREECQDDEKTPIVMMEDLSSKSHHLQQGINEQAFVTPEFDLNGFINFDQY